MLKTGMEEGMKTGMKSGMGTGMKAGMGLGVAMGYRRINRDHVTGALVGIGITALGYYLYKKNQNKVEGFLKKQGINVKESSSPNYKDMDLTCLVETKEHLEDLIAEKEMTEETIADLENEGME